MLQTERWEDRCSEGRNDIHQQQGNPRAHKSTDILCHSRLSSSLCCFQNCIWGQCVRPLDYYSYLTNRVGMHLFDVQNETSRNVKCEDNLVEIQLVVYAC